MTNRYPKSSGQATHEVATGYAHVYLVTLAHVLVLESLPSHHRDPFDRMLVAQAMVEGAALVSADSNIAKYAVQVVW